VPARAAVVSGVVHDSIARRPLAGATVQLVASDDPARFTQSMLSDSLGRFEFAEVPDGVYHIGFLHPMLDSLGIDPMLRAVRVEGGRGARADLAIPSPARLRAVICHAAGAPSGSAVVIGFVRDARERLPSPGARVSAQWLEYSVGRGGVAQRAPRRVVTAHANGWFALCDVPSPGSLLLSASRGADSTSAIEATVPKEGFLRRDLYLGGARSVVHADSRSRTDTLPVATPRMQVGDVRLSGRVLASASGLPLPGAQVSIANGPATRANAAGQFTFADAPAGTRTLEIRAVGYYPERRSIDVLEGAAPVIVALATLQSVLDTIKTVANRERYTAFREFELRSRIGVGRFLSAADVARRQPIFTSDLFNSIIGVTIDGDSIWMRSTFNFGERCTPHFYINGAIVRGLTLAEVNAFVRPREIMGLEVYSASQVPPQFQEGLNGCGSIVIWMR